VKALRNRLLPEEAAQRRLIYFIFVNTFGSGMYLTAGLLYLTRGAGLPATQAGLALTVAELIALPSNMLVGRLADRFGPRGLAAAFLLMEGVGMLALLWVRSVLTLAVVATAGAVAQQRSRTLRGVLIAKAGGEDRVRLRARSRSAANLAMALGAGAARAAVQLATFTAYALVIVADSVTLFAAALIVLRLPRYPPSAAPAQGTRLPGSRNVPYLTVTALGMHANVND
jgi:predicted MFS family arabinose efflux permease